LHYLGGLECHLGEPSSEVGMMEVAMRKVISATTPPLAVHAAAPKQDVGVQRRILATVRVRVSAQKEGNASGEIGAPRVQPR
jgi:hypothetical protein